MSSIIQLVEQVARLGCGMTLQQLLDSPRCHDEHQIISRVRQDCPSDSDQGIALAAGHLRFGQLLQTMDESTALATALAEESSFGHGVELRPVIWALGEALVTAATDCLTPEVVDLATQWRLGTADQQIAIAQRLQTIFTYDNQQSKGEYVPEDVLEMVFKNQFNNRHHPHRVLPRQYGPWNAQDHLANCQGIVQMLAAFARLAQAKAVAVEPIRNCRDLVKSWRDECIGVIRQDIAQRDLTADPAFMSSIRAAESYELLHEQINGISFHVAIALQLSDGRWILVDPHSLNWGVFSSHWDMPRIVGQLDKYRQALPGLHLLGYDHQTPTQVRAQQFAAVRDCLQHSRTFQAVIGHETNPLAITTALVASGEGEYLLRSLLAEDGLLACAGDRNLMTNALCFLLFGSGQDADMAQVSDHMRLYIMDPGFRRQKQGSWLTVHHMLALNGLRDQANQSGDLVHPECEFGHLEYHLALSAIQTQSSDWSNHDVERFFVDYNFDQLSLYNALAHFTGSPQEYVLAQAAHQALTTLPFRHPMCERKLKRFKMKGGEAS